MNPTINRRLHQLEFVDATPHFVPKSRGRRKLKGKCTQTSMFTLTLLYREPTKYITHQSCILRTNPAPFDPCPLITFILSLSLLPLTLTLPSRSHMHTFTRAHTHIHAYTHTHMHTHTHAYT